MAVAHILKQKGNAVVTASPGHTLNDIVELLAKHRIGAVVLLESDKIAGIISERDVVRALAEHGAAALSRKTADVMTRKVRCCTPRDSEGELMSLMTAHRIRHLPVIDGGTLIGMISIGDVVKHRIETIEREAEHMKQYIASAG